jgi:hypothetical protein
VISSDWLRRCLIATALLIAALLGHQAMIDEGAVTAHQPSATFGH